MERLEIGDDPFQGRLLFAAKEAVYKAVYPLDQTFLDHHDVQINFADRNAIVRNGRRVEIRLSVSAHLVALAASIFIGSCLGETWRVPPRGGSLNEREGDNDTPSRELPNP